MGPHGTSRPPIHLWTGTRTPRHWRYGPLRQYSRRPPPAAWGPWPSQVRTSVCSPGHPAASRCIGQWPSRPSRRLRRCRSPVRAALRRVPRDQRPEGPARRLRSRRSAARPALRTTLRHSRQPTSPLRRPGGHAARVPPQLPRPAQVAATSLGSLHGFSRGPRRGLPERLPPRLHLPPQREEPAPGRVSVPSRFGAVRP